MLVPKWSRLLVFSLLSIWGVGVALHFVLGIEEWLAGSVAAAGLPWVVLGQFTAYRWYSATSIYDRSKLRGKFVQAVGPGLAVGWAMLASLWLSALGN